VCPGDFTTVAHGEETGLDTALFPFVTDKFSIELKTPHTGDLDGANACSEGYVTKRNEPGIPSGLASSRAYKVMTLTRNMPPRQVLGTALDLDLGRIAFLANKIRKRLPMIDIVALRAGHTHRLVRIYPTDAERAFDCLSVVVHLRRL
jgi:hypothetical protein